ncbi:hypothetical protein [Streptomyces resistomycificus]|uniref:Uncharacterized protein n=1 Tax=Streptomyces resistomycificus TaxID=67356 RepID=A0A0L8L8L7_9ACTN|nr:hypothetical protein [Streptomyces resistomycificus]KOG34487.1 hypothetical protein ADK37_18305 [Streptomyces resistomycificus]KUO00694.1 hypothetical protein AQJ84_06755 [Streptomyces resistomycificus]
MSADDQSRLDDGRIRHLELIQTIVARMGNNSFLIKGWSLTVTGALLAYAVGNDKGSVALVSFLPVLAFWLLDGYFLYQERLFRRLYDRVRRQDTSVEPFEMKVAPGREEAGVLRAAVSPTLSGFYGGLVLALVFALLFVL